MKLQYTANRTPGGWRAHGRYLAREGAQREGEKGLGFDAQSTEVEIDRRLDGWQRAHDPRLWKMILSPERGDALDLVEHTRRVVDAMEWDLGTRLEWVAVDHRNTSSCSCLLRGNGRWTRDRTQAGSRTEAGGSARGVSSRMAGRGSIARSEGRERDEADDQAPAAGA